MGSASSSSPESCVLITFDAQRWLQICSAHRFKGRNLLFSWTDTWTMPYLCNIPVVHLLWEIKHIPGCTNVCLHMQRKTPSAVAKKPKKIDTFRLINGSCACYFKRIITATAKTMMPVLGMVNQPLAAAMTWAAVTRVLNDNNRRGWKTTLKATVNNDQWTWRVIAVHFTTPTHHHLLERRCLDINSPRSDPECMWLLCPGYR